MKLPKPKRGDAYRISIMIEVGEPVRFDTRKNARAAAKAKDIITHE